MSVVKHSQLEVTRSLAGFWSDRLFCRKRLRKTQVFIYCCYYPPKAIKSKDKYVIIIIICPRTIPMKWFDVVFPKSFIFPSAFDRSHCHLQRASDGCYLDERWYLLWQRIALLSVICRKRRYYIHIQFGDVGRCNKSLNLD